MISDIQKQCQQAARRCATLAELARLPTTTRLDAMRQRMEQQQPTRQRPAMFTESTRPFRAVEKGFNHD